MTPRVSEEAHRRSLAMAELKVQVGEFQQEHGLTTWEMASALCAWIELAAKYEIRRERAETDEERQTNVVSTGDDMRKLLTEEISYDNVDDPDWWERVHEVAASWVSATEPLR